MLLLARLKQSLPGGLALLWALVLAALLLAACGQPVAPALIVRDERQLLDPQRVADAAAPLLARGASVAVFVPEQGDDRGEDLSRRLAAEGLIVDGDIPPPLLVVYISYSPRYSELRAGSKWNGLLPSVTLRTIREGRLNPALRVEDPDDGVAATLAALEAEIARTLPRQRLIGWAVLAIGFAVPVVLLLAGPVERLWRRMQRAWPTSPPGRLWATTPIGRRQMRWRYRQELTMVREVLATSAERALERYAHVAIADEALERRRAALEAQRADLTSRASAAHAPSDDPALLTALRALPQSYELLVRDAQRLAADRASAHRRSAAVAAQAAELVRRVGKSFAPKPGAMVGDPVAYRQFTDLSATLDALDQRRAALGQALTDTALGTQLNILIDGYASLETALLALWASAFPKAHAGYLRQKQRAAASQARQNSGYTSDASSAGYLASSAGSSSSSDYQTDYGSSTSSSSSSDGGSW
ncbi:hypothetical protein [Candidatus Chloroploca sp. Khr17]|uniref:hypothetical protein n=1 Tax=Candidatus Chloroploca sp. Khr17 TaxID=2496869 RepID=UPI00101D4743|nr:hypothetical protein [Candidatus Chloroploca sp. Khr17]